MAMELDLKLDQGSRWIAVFTPQVEWLSSLAGYSARGKVKTSRTLSGASLLFDFAAYMTVQGNDVVVDVPADALAAQSWRVGEYDFELYDGNAAHDVRFLQGKISLDPEVTT